MAKKKRTSKLDPLRKELKVLVKEANERVSRLRKSKYASRALFEAQKSLGKSREGSRNLFTTDLKRSRDLQREFARVNKFLNDWTSMAEGAENFSKEFYTMKNVWGGQFEGNYDKTKLNSEFAEQAFRLYDMVVEEAGGWEQVKALLRDDESRVQFGSENLLNAIYDMIVQVHDPYSGFNPLTKDDELKGFDWEYGVKKRARALLEDRMAQHRQMSVKMRSNIDYGQIIDNSNSALGYYNYKKNSNKSKWFEEATK